jgi:hypothetical protein
MFVFSEMSKIYVLLYLGSAIFCGLSLLIQNSSLLLWNSIMFILSTVKGLIPIVIDEFSPLQYFLLSCAPRITGLSFHTLFTVQSLAPYNCFSFLYTPCQRTISSTISSMSDAMECPKCNRIFWNRRLFSKHDKTCLGSILDRTSVQHRLPPTSETCLP